MKKIIFIFTAVCLFLGINLAWADETNKTIKVFDGAQTEWIEKTIDPSKIASLPKGKYLLFTAATKTLLQYALSEGWWVTVATEPESIYGIPVATATREQERFYTVICGNEGWCSLFYNGAILIKDNETNIPLSSTEAD